MATQTSFSVSREQRNRFCLAKDAVLIPLLNKYVEVKSPRDFRAILMPSLYGSEAFWLTERGVPPSNIFAIENNIAEDGYDVHGEIVACRLPDRQELKGMQTTGKPESFSKALDEAYWCFKGNKFNLIYLDFLSQPDYDTHYRNGLLKIMRARMLADGATLILNFGRNRCRERTASLNKDIIRTARRANFVIKDIPTEIYVGAAIVESGHAEPMGMVTETYLSMPEVAVIRRTIGYSTTVVNF